MRECREKPKGKWRHVELERIAFGNHEQRSLLTFLVCNWRHISGAYTECIQDRKDRRSKMSTCFLRNTASYWKNNTEWYSSQLLVCYNDGCKLSGNTGREDEETGLNFVQSMYWQHGATEWVVLMPISSWWERMRREPLKETLWLVSAMDNLEQKSLWSHL